MFKKMDLSLTETLPIEVPALGEKAARPMPPQKRAHNFLSEIKNSSFFVKLLHWEFWSFNVVYFPTFFHYLWLSLKARSFLFFTASNPGIENAGFIGESKTAILNKINPAYTPPFLPVGIDKTKDKVLEMLAISGLTFPLIAKPDVGERGQGVQKIHSTEELVQYHSRIGVAYILQAFVDYPLELGVFYYRFPGEVKGCVSSVVIKDFLAVTGDGQSTLSELIGTYPRARFREAYLQAKFKSIYHEVLPAGETLLLEGIGNHVRGTTFLDGNYLINPALNEVFDVISHSVEGFYYGRYDLRCTSVEDLYRGKNIQIMELNGAGAEPAHIYQPGFSFWEGQKVLFQHWQILYRISVANHKAGVPYMTMKEARAVMKKHTTALQNIGI